MAYHISKGSISKQTHKTNPMKLTETIDQINNEDPVSVWALHSLALEDRPIIPAWSRIQASMPILLSQVACFEQKVDISSRSVFSNHILLLDHLD